MIRTRKRHVRMRSMPDDRLSVTFSGARRCAATTVYFKAHPVPRSVAFAAPQPQPAP